MKRSLIWNLYAKAYDVINKNIPYGKMLAEVVSEANLKDNLKILDAGCGTGNLEEKIVELFNVEIIGIDFSASMLNKARIKFNSFDNIFFQTRDINEGLDFPDSSFDRVVSINVLYALRNPENAILEFYRVLKSGGKLICSNPHKQAKFSKLMSEQLKELGLLQFIYKFLIYCPPLLIIIFINLFFLRKNNNYWNKDETINIFNKIGFKDIQIKYTYANQNLLVSAIKY